MKKEIRKNLGYSLVIPVLSGTGWIMFILIYFFLWSTNFSFYQTLSITFVTFTMMLTCSVFSILWARKLKK
jgi:hypothetical protein